MTILQSTFFVSSAAQSDAKVEQWDKAYSMSIQDNSFLVEEAFNQEENVVQHISTIRYLGPREKQIDFSFTQEWPLWSSKHQFSYEIPYSAQSSSDERGIGDIAINYRYQLSEKESGVAIAPRLSMILPTGDQEREFGMGVVGFETNIAVSRRFSEEFIAHANAGTSIFPEVKGATPKGEEVKRPLSSYTLGASAIWLTNPNYNLMLEYVAEISSAIDPDGNLSFSTDHVVSPGIRAAINLESLQIVPGFAVPIRFADGDTEVGAFAYLSFEHPF
ncbi:MAG: transporter [Ignavibacteria bacterium]|nr:transporter [Ignavibacteria bacterium]MBI3765189.1 transporter [Ignavibacteriales bacterium]